MKSKTVWFYLLVFPKWNKFICNYKLNQIYSLHIIAKQEVSPLNEQEEFNLAWFVGHLRKYLTSTLAQLASILEKQVKNLNTNSNIFTIFSWE